MHNELKHLIDIANGLLKTADVGREFTMDYVVNRLNSALEEFPHDAIINSIAQIVHKQVKNGKLVTSQKELYDIYNHFAGLSTTSAIKEVLGDLLYKPSITHIKMGSETEVSYRSTSPELDMKIEHNPLSSLFDKHATPTSYYDPTLAKLGKNLIEEELNSIGIPATDIKVFAGNDYAIIYDATFNNKLGTAHVAIPVETLNGIVPPTVFFNKNEFTNLTSENLNKYIVDVASTEEIGDVGVSGGVRTASSVVSPSFDFDDTKPIDFGKTELPSALKDLAIFENAVIDAGTHFSPMLVRTAKAVCLRELNSMGLKTQVVLSEVSDNCIICRAELDSSVGKVEIKLPVEIVNGQPQIPSLFYNENEKDKVYDFTRAEVINYLTASKPDNGQIIRYSNDFFNMTYNQLKEEMIAGVANKDYNRAEQALSRIEDKFGDDHHRAALSDYAKYLVHASKPEEAPKHKCRLLITKGSIEPRCGHYNVAIGRVETNEKGDCVLLDRKAKYENLAESAGTLIRTNKITLT